MTLETSAVGLDIDSRSIHLVRIARRLGRIVVTHSRSAMLAENGTGDESVILRSIEALGAPNERIGLSIFGRSVILNSLAVPPTEHSQARVAEAEIKRLGFLSEEPVITSHSTHHRDTESSAVLIAMAQTQLVEDTLALPDSLGLGVSNLTPIPIALLRAAQLIPGRHPVQIVAHIRSESTHVLIGGHSGLLFTRRFEIGSHHFTDAVRTATGLRTDAAEEAHHRVGFIPLTHPSPPDASIQAALFQTADAWTAELHSTISLWRDRNIERTLDDQPVSLSGLDVLLPGFLDYVAGHLNRAVQPIPLPVNGLTPVDAPAHTVALGLALAAIEHADDSINLLPPERRLALRMKIKRHSWLRIAATLSTVLLLVIAGTQWRSQAIQRALLLADGEIRPLQSLESEELKLKSENELLQSRLTALLAGTGTSQSLQDLMRALAAAKHENDWITAITDSTTYFAATPTPAPLDPSNPRTLTTVVIEGYSPSKDFSTVLSMIERLRHDACVAHADLVSDDRIPTTGRELWSGLDVVLFVVEITLNEP